MSLSGLDLSYLITGMLAALVWIPLISYAGYRRLPRVPHRKRAILIFFTGFEWFIVSLLVSLIGSWFRGPIHTMLRVLALPSEFCGLPLGLLIGGNEYYRALNTPESQDRSRD